MRWTVLLADPILREPEGMGAAQRQDNSLSSRRVLLSNTAANMISSLHPANKSKVSDALATIKSSVIDPANVKKIVGVDSVVARA
jgi:hypothetical protein